MAKAINEKEEESTIVFDKADEVLNTGEAFIENNQKPIFIGLGIVAALVVGIILFKSAYLEPREQTAKESIFKAEQLFAMDSFQLALDGTEDAMGFLEIIDEYGCTDAGNIANAYAGVCYKQLGDNEKAIKYLEKFSADDAAIQYAIIGAVGDCYWDLGDAKKAISYYKKAAAAENPVVTPFYKERAGIACMSIEDYTQAIALFEEILKKYPEYSNIMDVKKYIEVAKAK